MEFKTIEEYYKEFRNTGKESFYDFLEEKLQEAKNNNDTWLEKAIYFAERYAKYIQFLHKRHPDTNIKNFSENAVLDCSESEISTSLANQSLSLLRHYWNYNDIFYVPCSL